MAYLNVYRRINGEHDLMAVKNYVRDQIGQFWKVDLSTIDITKNESFSFHCNLSDIVEHAMTRATVIIKSEPAAIILKAEGKVSLGKLPWLWFFLGFGTGFFFALFLFDLVLYLFSKNKPKEYFEDIFNSVEKQSIGSLQ
jgi:hypothetical protein